MLVTEEQINQFHEDGAILLKNGVDWIGTSRKLSVSILAMFLLENSDKWSTFVWYVENFFYDRSLLTTRGT